MTVLLHKDSGIEIPYEVVGVINTQASVENAADYPVYRVVRVISTSQLVAAHPDALGPIDVILRAEPSHAELVGGSCWIHSNGTTYRCHGVAEVITHSDGTHNELVIYEDIKKGILWGKAPARFLKGMTPL